MIFPVFLEGVVIIEIDESRPFDSTGMSSEKWLEIEPSYVLFNEIILSQEYVSTNALLQHLNGAIPIGGDVFPHVVMHNGKAYLEDGHTRVTLKLVAGESGMDMRVLRKGL